MTPNPVKMSETCRELIKSGKCQADCCSLVPIPKQIFDANISKARPVKERKESEGQVYAWDDRGRCVFLSLDFECAIHENRPQICRDYGIKEEEGLFCKFIKPNGNLRSKNGIKICERSLGKMMKEFEKKAINAHP